MTSSTNAYPTTGQGALPAASSLVGNVGSSTATGISLTFSDMRLDARTDDISNSSANTTLSSKYGTTRSIFDRATFLEKFQHAGNSFAEYNYDLEEDWDGTTPVHHVTYAKEITNSVEFSGKQVNYYDYYGETDNHHTSPVESNASAVYTGFSSGFMSSTAIGVPQ